MKHMKIAMIVIGALGVLNAALLYCCIRVGSCSDAHLGFTEDELDDLEGNWWEDEMDGCE